ncbi:MAG TPA: aspartate-semialdehyde dehydrogenase, partial [Sorangium sp.]|nr:aspartate-semialdehyde dehydrogenase [Sorangium sp.]
PTLGVSPTCVRVPVATGHSESVHIRCQRPLSVAEVRAALSDAPGVTLVGDGYVPGEHPQPAACVGTDEVFVGRIREDLALPGAINMWIVADNLRKGAALNAVQIAERLRR